MSITVANNSFLIDQNVSAVAFESFFAGQFMMPLLYSLRGSSKAREILQSTGGIGDYEEITETQDLPEDEAVQQFQKTFVHVEYGKKLAVSRKAVDDDEWGFVEDLGQQLGFKASETMEKKGAAVLADAFTGATYLGEDAKALCHTAHVNVDGGNSQGNKGTYSLNFAGIKATRQLMRRFKNYSGDILGVAPDTIICAIESEEDAWEAIRSTGKPDTANNNANVYNGMFSLIVWPYLDDTNAWFMVQSSLMKQNLLWLQRIAFEVMGEGNLMLRTKKVGGYWRSSHGFRDWRWVYGNNPS